jgi:hypothetical protein
MRGAPTGSVLAQSPVDETISSVDPCRHNLLATTCPSRSAPRHCRADRGVVLVPAPESSTIPRKTSTTVARAFVEESRGASREDQVPGDPPAAARDAGESATFRSCRRIAEAPQPGPRQRDTRISGRATARSRPSAASGPAIVAAIDITPFGDPLNGSRTVRAPDEQLMASTAISNAGGRAWRTGNQMFESERAISRRPVVRELRDRRSRRAWREADVEPHGR